MFDNKHTLLERKRSKRKERKKKNVESKICINYNIFDTISHFIFFMFDKSYFMIC